MSVLGWYEVSVQIFSFKGVMIMITETVMHTSVKTLSYVQKVC